MMPVISCEGFTKAQMSPVFGYLEEKGAVGYIIVYDEPYFTGIPEEPEEEPVVVPPGNVPVAPQQPQTPVVPNEPEKEPEEEPEMFLPPSSDDEEEYSNPGVTVTPFG